ncbi:SDR family NAD(P)-dependent oxidoreductase [Luteimonas sp. MC1572]|uniref:SDR family NAD(P)-dependent oxidoreductase n=1 Tax=Luteimonas sp. MC1572 TaxID=2799325 RepID=UPI0018F06871|nr:SDR family NAD(P)-dependent oxidoreductase [Luteimonas sp. MC1572]MBJ6982619.1 SDR family NAD(P)-dependent oxidoreductase [Luteimonas sp. MC1572]QQO03866.1 SDR family NAD(P)-dependent oxidoreductase [Luteimonas sp. MC1572]
MSAHAADDGAPAALAGRVVLVTGAAGGLGAAAAHACARAGASVVLLGRKVPKLNRVYDAIANDPAGLPEPVNYPFDLAGAGLEDHAELAARIQAQLGRLDGVLHCAADFAGLTPLEHTDPAAFARALHVDLTARWWLTQACLPMLRQASDSAVVFVVDDAAPDAAYRGAYGIAQQAQLALLATLHAELATSPVRVSALRPGPMRTPLRARAYVEDQDLRARDPARYADACVHLLAPAGVAHRGQVWAPTP